jgi:hypothetical protein
VECLDIPKIGLGLFYLDKDGSAQKKRDEKNPQKHEFLKAT